MNPICLKIGVIEIYWYSIFILLGIIVAYFLILKEAKKHNIQQNFVNDLVFYTVLFGLIGARIYYVVFEYKQYINDPIDIFKVWEGGLAIHGGIIAGLITVIVIFKKHKKSIDELLKMTDIAVVGLIVAQAIGRWGNFFNSEAYGPSTTLSFLQSLHLPSFIISGMNIDGIYYQPTFLYESLWNILGFIILLLLRHTKKLRVGQLTGVYFIWYSLGRFFIESLRQDSLMLFGILKQAQIISIIAFISGVVLLIICRKRKKYNE